jgi:hypothetical protein
MAACAHRLALTSIQADFAADELVLINAHNPVRAFNDGLSRTDIYAGSLGAVSTGSRKETPLDLRENSGDNFLYSPEINRAGFDAFPLLAGHFVRFAFYTLV